MVCAATANDELRAQLAGEVLAAVERDVPAGRVPHWRGGLRITMSLLPIFLKLDGRPGLLVGAGTVALEKIGSLLKTGIRLRVVAPEAKAEIRELAAEGKLEWINGRLRKPILTGNFIVIAATDVPEVNTPPFIAWRWSAESPATVSTTFPTAISSSARW